LGGRKLQLRARAERMAKTRRRIVEAAYDLHCTLGPARTTISAIAERAGVQRHTVYQHFPDDLTLFGACTAHGLAIDPPPDPAQVGAIRDPRARLRATLTQLYGYYRRNESLLSNTARDEPELLQRMRDAGIDWRDVPESVRRYSELPVELRDALAAGWPVRGTRRSHLRAVLGLALDFGTWRVLTRDARLDQDEAVELMVHLVSCAATASESAAMSLGARRAAPRRTRRRTSPPAPGRGSRASTARASPASSPSPRPRPSPS
jgi:AcrR family transcriptional regulator